MRLVPGSVVVPLRIRTEETKTGDQNLIGENERWSSYAMDDDDGSSSAMKDAFSLDLGDEWMNWRVDDPELESGESAEE